MRLVWQQLLSQAPLSTANGRRLVDEVLYLGGACHPNDVLAKYIGVGDTLKPHQLADVIVQNPFI